MNFDKLKETARKYEQKEDWRRAIEVYREAIRKYEAGDDPATDLSVYNRVGDLYLKANDSAAAVQAYERAVDLYGEQGFYNNAIALCGKILRVNPGRVQVYLKLANLHAHKNVVIEAKKNLLEYVERMNALHQLDEAFRSLKGFADQFPGNQEIRMMLVDLLRASSRHAEAREQMEQLVADLEARGDTIGARKTLQQLQAMDSDGSTPAAAQASSQPATPPKRKPGDLVFLDTGLDEPPAAPPPRKTQAVRPPAPAPAPAAPSPPGRPAAPPPSKAPPPRPSAPAPRPAAEPPRPSLRRPAEEDHDLDTLPPLSDEAQLDGLGADTGPTLGFEPTHLGGMDTSHVSPIDGLDTGGGFGSVAGMGAATDDDFIIRSDQGGDFSFGLPVAEGGSDQSDDWDTDLTQTSASVGAAGLGGGDDDGGMEATIAALEDRVLDDPGDPEAHRALGEALLASGDSLRGQEELELALAGYEERQDWDHATDLLNELVRLDPNGVRYHQKRVEISYHSGDRGRLIDAYLDLADSLLRVGTLDKALAVYRRVSEHDPGNRRAQAALEALAPPEEAPPPSPAPTLRRPAAPEVPARPAARPVEPVAKHHPAAPPKAPPAAPPKAAPPPHRAEPVTHAPPPPAPPRRAEPEHVSFGAGDSDFIDLGEFVQEGGRQKDTRMRVEGEEPTGDEQKDFQTMLQQFKRGIDENIEADDFDSHYDLGVAFKEMGLLDEAIAEFQKALRSPQNRLKTSEALGTAFFEKGQYAIAETILGRAVETLGAGDEEQIGLIYWLGRARESQTKIDLAMASYERVMAVDIGFQDTSARVARLHARRAR